MRHSGETEQAFEIRLPQGEQVAKEHPADVDALLARADEAMYANKRARRAPPRELTDEATA